VHIRAVLTRGAEGGLMGALGASLVAIRKSYNLKEAICIGVVAGFASSIVQLHMFLVCYTPCFLLDIVEVLASNPALGYVANDLQTFVDVFEPIPSNMVGTGVACYIIGEDVAKGAACGAFYGLFVTIGRIIDQPEEREEFFARYKSGKWENAMMILGATIVAADILKGGEVGSILGLFDSGMLCAISLGSVNVESVEELENHFLSDILRQCAETIRSASPALWLEDR
jgi:hypothetical protein